MPEAQGPILVIHAPADEAFARGYLAPALGIEPAATLSAAELALLSTPDLEQRLRGSRVIAIATPALFADAQASYAETLASGEERNRRARVIPLVLEEVVLPPHLGYDVKLDFRRRKDWDRGVEKLRKLLAQPALARVRLRCPYPGMQPFGDDQAACFHGRSAEIEEVLGRLAAGDRELYVIGPSGCGKSSLITAGVLPRLAAVAAAAPAGPAVVAVAPGDPAPAAAAAPIIVRRLRPGGLPARRLAEVLEAGGEDAAAGLAACLGRHPGARLVVFIDQLEELLTQADAGERARFAAALRALRAEPRCVLLLALRADFFAELLESELWRDGAKRHVDLLPLRGAALREAIELPARAAGAYFEHGLVERLLADADDAPGVLPMMQATLVQLWERMSERLLALADYEALGEGGRSGLAVAISSHADRCLHEMTAAQEAIARRTLLRLVSFGEGRPSTRRRQPRSALGAGERAGELDEVMGRLEEARLITVDSDERTGEDRVDLCHEALIAAWPSFARWVEARRADEQRRRALQASADEWVARGRGESGLLDEGELATAEAWRETDAARELGEATEVTALVAASGRALGARRRHRRWLIGGAAGALCAFGIVAAVLAVSARRSAATARAERRASERLLGEQERELGRQLVVDGRDEQAIPLLVSAREHGVDDPVLRMLFRTATQSPVVAAVRHRAAVTSASFSRDGARLVTSSRDRTARLWDARTGAPLSPPLLHPDAVASASLSTDGARLVTVCRDGAARIWDLSATPPTAIVLRHDAPIELAAWSAGGARVVTADARTARVWTADAGQPVSTLRAREYGKIRGVAISRDGARVVTASGVIGELWDAATGRRIALLETTAHTARFSPDGARFITAGSDNTTHLYDSATGEPLDEIRHGATVIDVAFGRDASQLAAARSDGNVWIYDRRALSVAAHPPSVRYVVFSADGTRMLTQGHDKTVRIWDPARATPLASLKLGAGANAAAISPDGAYVVTPGADGVARVWRVAQAPRELGERVEDGAYSPDGARIAVWTGEEVQLWSRAGEVQWRARPREDASRTLSWRRLLWSPDGGRLALITPGYEIQIWDVATGATRSVSPESERANDNLPLSRAPPGFAWSPDGRRFASAVTRTRARIWDAATGEAVTPPLLHAGALVSIRWSPDGRRVLTAAQDGAARLWDAATGRPHGPVLVHPGDLELLGAELSPDGARIATIGGDQLVRLWDAATGQLGLQLEHTAPVSGVVFVPGGGPGAGRVLTECADQSLRIWDVATGELAAPPITQGLLGSAAFSPDGARIVTVAETAVQVWDAATGRPLTPPRAHPDRVGVARFGPDGGSLLTIARGKLRIWDVGLDVGSLEDWQALAERGALRRRTP